MMTHLERQYAGSASTILRTADGPLGTAWMQLEQWRRTVGLPTISALRSIAPQSHTWLAWYVERAVTGSVTDKEVADFRRAALILQAEPPVAGPLDNRLVREQMLDNVRAGNLPRASADRLHLPTDEICYLNVQATRVRE